MMTWRRAFFWATIIVVIHLDPTYWLIIIEKMAKRALEMEARR